MRSFAAITVSSVAVELRARYASRATGGSSIGDALAQRYRVALTEGAIPAVAGPLDAAALGLFRIACIAGWCR